MKILLSIVVLVLSIANSAAQTASEFGNVNDTIELSPNTLHHIYIASGFNTTIRFHGSQPVGPFKFGSEIVAHGYDPELRELELMGNLPEGTEGEYSTNMNVTIGDQTYVFLIHIVQDSRVQYSVTVSLPSGPRGGSQDLPIPSAAPRKKPFEIDTVAAIKLVERGRTDPVFRQRMQNEMFTLPIGKDMVWNNCVYTLVDAHYLLSQDLIILKAEWENSTDKGIHLNVNQVEIWIRNHKVPVTAKQQYASLLFPGQRDVHYFFIQGLRLNLDLSLIHI